MSGYQVPEQSHFNVLPIYPVIAPSQTLTNLVVENLYASTGVINHLTVNTGVFDNLDVNEVSAAVANIDIANIEVANIDTLTGPAGQRIDQIEFNQDMVYPQTDDVYNLEYNAFIEFLCTPSQSTFDGTRANFYQVDIPLSTIVSGTELVTSYGLTGVYGYTGVSGASETLTGGTIYNTGAGFGGITFNVSAPDDYYLSLYSSAPLTNALTQAGSYLQQRGYMMPQFEVNPAFDNAFVYEEDTFYFLQAPLYTQFYIKPVLDGDNNITSIKVAANVQDVNNFGFFIAMNPDLNNPKDCCLTWLTLPVVTTYDDFIAQIEAGNSVAYWNALKGYVSIDVRNKNIKVCNFPFNNVGTCFFEFLVEFYLSTFQGTFAFVTRDAVSNRLNFNNYVPTATAMVQISPTVTIQSTQLIEGTSVGTVTNINSVLGQYNHSYNGYSVGRKQNGLEGYPVNVSQQSNFLSPNSFVAFISEFTNTYPQDQISPIANKVKAYCSTISSACLLDSTNLDSACFYIDPSYIASPSFPENLPSLPLTTIQNISKANDNIVAKHELVHSIQYVAGMNGMVDIEAQATAIELDERCSFGASAKFRTYAFVRYLLPFYRGQFPLVCEPGMYATIPLGPYNKYGSYGASMFYDYLKRRFDPNHQILRRTMEIVGTVTFGPALYSLGRSKALNWIDGLGYLFNFNPAGTQFALQQAMTELLNVNLKDVFCDYCVSACLLRNNLSIPAVNRAKYPYWIYSASNNCPIQSIMATDYSTQSQSYAYWWDQVNNPTSAQNNPFTLNRYGAAVNAESLYPSWPRYASGSSGAISLAYNAAGTYVTSYTSTQADMSLRTWVMPDSFTGVNVTANTGEIRACVIKFTSNGGNTGTYQSTGWISIPNGNTQSFNLAPFVAQVGGFTKLLVANVKITNYAALDPSNPLANFQGCALALTGSTTITVNF